MLKLLVKDAVVDNASSLSTMEGEGKTKKRTFFYSTFFRENNWKPILGL